jgi:16S rRNA (guanine527-N7)-methyltransferase
VRYAEILLTDGVERGLIGPREAPRIWERHLLNCAAVAELVPAGAILVDVGSGAGLPGLVLAVGRPDLSVVLIEPLARRATFLREAISRLGLAGVTVVRTRAEEAMREPGLGAFLPADIATARAVAPIDQLARWSLPLIRLGGRLLALKGEQAPQEVDEHRATLEGLGAGEVTIRRCGDGLIDPPTTVVEISRATLKEPAYRPAERRGRRHRPGHRSR